MFSTASIRQEIDAAVGDGATLEEIEDMIVSSLDVSEELQAALWLYAWGALERAQSGLGRPVAHPSDPRHI